MIRVQNSRVLSKPDLRVEKGAGRNVSGHIGSPDEPQGAEPAQKLALTSVRKCRSSSVRPIQYTGEFLQRQFVGKRVGRAGQSA